MKKLLFVCLLSLVTAPAFAQSKLDIPRDSVGRIYLSPGVGFKHANLITTKPEFWYGAQVSMELTETMSLAGRLKWDFANGRARSAVPSAEVGLWYKIGL